MKADPDCVHNLADSPMYARQKAELWSRLKTRLTAQNDPRILGRGDIFDAYPNCRIDKQQKLYKRPDWDPVQRFNQKYGKSD
jgi:hypothetical protein